MNSILETVCSICNSIRDKTKQGISFQKLLTVIRQEFGNNNLNIKFRSSRKKFLNQEEFYVNAYYDAEDDKDGDVCIEVITYHNFDKITIWDQKHITDFLIQIYDAVVHEFKHQRQSKHRNHQIFWQKQDGSKRYHSYLADPDEIDAYALSIAIELCRTLGKFRALRYLSKTNTLARLKIKDHFVSPNLSAYVGQFGIENPIIKSLSKKIYVRLQKIDTDFIFV